MLTCICSTFDHHVCVCGGGGGSPPSPHTLGGRAVLKGEKTVFQNCNFAKKTVCSSYRQPWLVAIGGWWLAIGGWWRSAVGGWRRLAVLRGSIHTVCAPCQVFEQLLQEKEDTYHHELSSCCGSSTLQ